MAEARLPQQPWGEAVSSLEVLVSPAVRAEVPQVSLGTWHTAGGSCRSRGGSNASDHPCYAVVCVLVSFALKIASLLSNDGSARWDGWVGSQERV